MPRYNVQRKDGQWACFSSIVDDFITDFMPREEYQQWRIREYGIHCGEIEQANIMEYDEAMSTALCTRLHETDIFDDYDGDSDCNVCPYWNKEMKKCEIVEKVGADNG